MRLSCTATILASVVLGSCSGAIQDGTHSPSSGQNSGAPGAGGPKAGGGAGTGRGGAPTNETAPQPTCAATDFLPPRLVRLAGDELRAHLREAFPSVSDARLALVDLQGEHFSPLAERGISAGDLGALYGGAQGIADEHVTALPANAPCRTDGQEGPCARDTLRPLVAKLFRREPRADEWSELVAGHASFVRTHGAAKGTAVFLAGVILAPQVLFHTERGVGEPSAGVTAIGGREALLLARYAFTGKGPSLADEAALVGLPHKDLAAKLGELAGGWTKTGEFKERALDFLERWIGVEHLGEVERSGGPFDAPVKRAMTDEFREFATGALFADGASFDGLFDSVPPSRPAALASIYAPQGAKADTSDRKGLLGLAAVLAAHAAPDGSDPVKRGVLVRTGLLCEPMPPPVDDADFSKVDVTPDMQTRERFEVLAQAPACRSCHTVINPPGYLFEAYDQLGRHRTTEKGKPIDSSGTIPPFFGATPYDGVGSWSELGQLSAWVARSPDVRRCFAAHFASYLLAEAVPNGPKNCTVASLSRRFAETGRLEHLAEDVVRSELFLYRRREMP